MTQPEHILVIDDDVDVREAMADYLRLRGWLVTTGDGGAALRELCRQTSFDLVLLDLVLPGENGLSLLRYVREHTRAAVMMVTGVADTIDRVVGLEMGADDYIAKPLELRELAARVRSVLRRQTAATVEETDGRLRFGAFVLDHARRQLTRLDGSAVTLTAMEYRLLEVLAARPREISARVRLLDLAYGKADEPFDRSIDLHVLRLRRKIETNPTQPRHIRTIRGTGYRFFIDPAEPDGLS